MTDIIIFGFFFILIFILSRAPIKNGIKNKIIITIKPKTGLKLGLYLILAAFIIF